MASSPAAGRAKRLLLRLTTTCNSGCAHCPLADLRQLQHREPTTAQAIEQLSSARASGCTEVVFLRGEATIRPDFLRIVRAAARGGYRLIQLQSNGRRLADPRVFSALLRAGLTHLELSLYGATADIHDAIAGCPGAFEQTSTAIRYAAERRVPMLVNVHIVRANVAHLADIVEYAADLGATRVQLGLARPVPPEDGGVGNSEPAFSALRDALSKARDRARGHRVSLQTEAIPDCAFDDPDERPADAWADAGANAMRVDDLHRTVDDVSALRRKYRAESERCGPCERSAKCPRTWSSYLESIGEAALLPFY